MDFMSSVNSASNLANELSTHCVTKMNMIASKMLLAEFLKTKLPARAREYTVVNELVMSTPKTEREMKNKITNANIKRRRLSVFKATLTSRML